MQVFLNTYFWRKIIKKKIIKLSTVKDITALSSATIYRLIQKGEFPKQIKLSERSSGWLLEEIYNWLEQRITYRDGENS